jgi:hypothetical protein
MPENKGFLMICSDGGLGNTAPRQNRAHRPLPSPMGHGGREESTGSALPVSSGRQSHPAHPRWIEARQPGSSERDKEVIQDVLNSDSTAHVAPGSVAGCNLLLGRSCSLVTAAPGVTSRGCRRPRPRRREGQLIVAVGCGAVWHGDYLQGSARSILKTCQKTAQREMGNGTRTGRRTPGVGLLASGPWV